jgi:hypothetical protein
MEGAGVAIRVGFSSKDEADKAVSLLQADGVEASVDTSDVGFLPVAVLLALVIPPGAALLAKVVNRIVHEWREHGILIDARGTGAPVIIESNGIPYGVINILTRDGDEVEHSLLPEEDLSKYVAAAVTSVTGGASASDAEKDASEQATKV